MTFFFGNLRRADRGSPMKKIKEAVRVAKFANREFTKHDGNAEENVD